MKLKTNINTPTGIEKTNHKTIFNVTNLQYKYIAKKSKNKTNIMEKIVFKSNGIRL